MSDYVVYASGIVLTVVIGLAGYLFARKSQSRKIAAASEGAMLRTLVDNLPDLIYVKDVNGRFLLANIAEARIMGAKTPSELLGKNDFDFHPRELATRYHEDEQAVIRSGKPLLAREEECRHPAGHLVRLETTKIPLRDAGGAVTGLVGIGRDITLRVTEAQALDEAVRESREVIQAVLGGASDRRIAMDGKSGNLHLLAQSINELIDSVSTTVAETGQVMRRAVEGDLTSRMNVNDKLGDFKVLATAVNSMIQAMMEVVASLSTTSNAVQVGAAEISRGSLALSNRTEVQASSLEETSSTMEQMTSMVKNNANNAAQASQLAVAAREKAEGGGKVVGAAVTAMSEINTASNKIVDVIGVIDEIAFQTNLLALNAAVEAARAGEQGQSFAVVAAEVRNLASRSAEAAKEIKALIQDSVRKVNEGTKLVDQSGEVLGEIVLRVKKVTDVIADIANSSREQASGIEQVNKAVTAMDAMTQQNAALVEEAAAAATALNEQATSLTRLIGHYRLS
ncbi:MAG TPA: methyl-accepting chemotaxis protein [Steroidobacteraceae bacterium]|nr:methyl-accepting chemotaxis protein [Steroidobacteraceae bacterium]